MIGRMLSALSVAALAGGAVYAQNTDAMAPAAETPSLVTNAATPQNEAPDAKAVTTKDDARVFGESEFKIADANADGKIELAEFIAYTEIRMNAEAEAAHATDMAAVTGEGDIDTPAEGETQIAELDAEGEMKKPEETFAEIAGGKDTINEKTLVKARLAAFDEADANDDETLDDSEKVQFAALVTGRTAS